VRIGSPAPPHLCGGILTAYNPGSRARSRTENRDANARLRERLLGEGAELLEVRALPDDPRLEAWEEPGFLARHLPRDEVVAIADEFGQNAIVWISPGSPPELVCSRQGFAGHRRGETIPGTDTDDART
jgi:hypothetical protein